LAKIVFITSRFPYPLNKGDKLRVYFQLKSLAEEHEVYLIALDEKKIADDLFQELSFCKSIHVFIIPLYKRILALPLSVFRNIPLQVGFFYNAATNKKIQTLISEIAPTTIHCHLIRTTEYVKQIKSIPKSLDFMDAFAAGMDKRQLFERNVWKRMLFKYEAKQLRKYEKKVFDFIDRFSIISDQDRLLMEHSRSSEIKVIPNGVDLDSFYPRSDEKKYDILFMGNLGYPPNIEAVYFIVNELLPLLRKVKPEIKLLIAGVEASNRMKRFQSSTIDVVEHFQHISDSIAMSRIMLAPMFMSIGLQNKILQAMAMKVPCIVSRASNNAIHAPAGSAVIEANTASEFAEQVLRMLENSNHATAIADAGYEFVLKNYTWLKQHKLLNHLITSSH
jgi:polysaccharide biosynthesis protein PslH